MRQCKNNGARQHLDPGYAIYIEFLLQLVLGYATDFIMLYSYALLTLLHVVIIYFKMTEEFGSQMSRQWICVDIAVFYKLSRCF